MSVAFEKLVSASESRLRGSVVCSLADSRTHLVVSHGCSLSVREVRRNHAELIAVHALSAPLLFLSVVCNAGRAAVFVLLSDGHMALLGLSRASGAWELFPHTTRQLDLASVAIVSRAARCEYDEQRCAAVVFVPVEPVRQTEFHNTKKRSVVVRESPPLVYLLRFSFDKYPKILTKCEPVKWKYEWSPLSISFLSSQNPNSPWGFGCYHPSVGIKTFAIKTDDEPEFRELKLVIAPTAAVCDMRFIEGTTLLVAYPTELALFNGAVQVASLRFPGSSNMRIFSLGRRSPPSFVIALSDGSLHLATLTDDHTSMISMFLGHTSSGGGTSMAITVSLLSTVSFKQGPCHLVFIGCASGDTTLSFIVPSNPTRRLQHLVTLLSLAPVTCIVPTTAHRRVYMSFGLRNDSGIACIERVFRYRAMLRYPTEHVRDVFLLDKFTCAFAFDTSTRIVQLVPSDDMDVKLTEVAFPATVTTPTLAIWKAVGGSDFVALAERQRHIRVSAGSVELLDGSFVVLATCKLESEAIAAVSDCNFNISNPSVMVLCRDAQVRRFRLVASSGSTIKPDGSCAFPGFSGRKSQLICVGKDTFMLGISNGILHCDYGKFGVRWDPFSVRNLSGKTVLSIAVSPFSSDGAMGGPPFVYIAALCTATPNAKTRHWYMVIFAFWLHASTTAATDATVFLFDDVDERAVGGMHFSTDTRFKHCVSVDIGSTVYCVAQTMQENWVVSAGDDFVPMTTLMPLGDAGAASETPRCVTILSSLNGGGLALGWHAEITYLPRLMLRHSETLVFIACFPELNLIVGLDAKGIMLGMFVNQVDSQTKRLSRHDRLYELPSAAIVSDMQRIDGCDGSYLLAVAYSPSVASAAQSESRLTYPNREIVFLEVSVVGGIPVIRRSASHHTIAWPGTGSCQLQVRPLPHGSGRLVAACDSQLKAFEFLEQKPDAKTILAVDLRSGNDIVSFVSLQGPYVTISHVFGAIVVMKCSSTNEFETHCKGSCDGDAPATMMLSSDVALAPVSGGQSVGIFLRNGNKLLQQPGAVIKMEGSPSCSMFDRNLAFFGTAAGEIFVVRTLTSTVADEVRMLLERGNASVDAAAVASQCFDAKLVRAAIDRGVVAQPNIDEALKWL